MEYVVIIILGLVFIALLSIIISNLYHYIKKKRNDSFSYKMSLVENGMKKDEVIKILGEDYKTIDMNTISYDNKKYDVTLKFLNNKLKSLKSRKKW